MNPVTFDVTFVATVPSDFANYGVNGYLIGNSRFRSIASLTSALTTAFAKDFGPYRELEVNIIYRINGEQHQATCTADTYQDVLTAIESSLTEEKITIESLLGE